MDHRIHTLPNGIRILHKFAPSSISHACIVINAGSRDELTEKGGMAHFIEHLLFKRTQKRNTNQILNRLESVGADLNAYTTKEYTCIHASFLNEYLERTIDLFQDVAFHSIFPEDEMEKEKGVILDEITSYLDQPEEAINDDFEDQLFAGHPLGCNILGTADSVKALQRSDIFDFMASNYNTNEIIVGIFGNYNFDKVVKMCAKLMEHIPSNVAARQRRGPQLYTPSHIMVEKPISQSHCVIGNRAYNINEVNKVGLLLLNNVLGGNGMSSRLNLELREKHGIAYTIESNYSPLSDTGIFSVYFGTDPEKVNKALKIIHNELKKLRDNRLGTIQLHQAKQKFIGQIALAEENRIGVIVAMTKSLIDYGRIDSLEEIFAKINAVTADQILAVANETFDTNQLSSLLFYPEN